jgi:FeS assembly SUF system regulator
MLRLTKLADYGILILTFFAANPENKYNARSIANALKLPLPVASKVLKLLTLSGLLTSHRGAKGGYTLARAPQEINVASIIRVFEGPMAVTECSSDRHSCELQFSCPARTHWNFINAAIHSALEKFTLAHMEQPLNQPFVEIKLTGRSLGV